MSEHSLPHEDTNQNKETDPETGGRIQGTNAEENADGEQNSVLTQHQKEDKSHNLLPTNGDASVKLSKTVGDTVYINIEDETGLAGPSPADKELLTADDKQPIIIDILTEKQIEPIIEGRQRTLWTMVAAQFAGEEFKHEPVGEPIAGSYTSDRNAFVRTVFILTASMLIVTVAFTYCAMRMVALRILMHRTGLGIGLLVASVFIIVVVDYAFCCSPCTSTVPCNYITLVFVTCAYSYLVAFLAIRYDYYIVFIAALSTFGVTVFCTVLACTSFDFTRFLLLVLVAGVALGFGLIGTALCSKFFGMEVKTLRLIILICATLVSALTLVIELQMILGGKTVELGEEDYAYGAFLLYVSIIDLFLKLLQIFNELET